MPLSPGTRLGPYEILSLVGAGGMGEVYRARDTRLDRVVALKVLSAQLAANPLFQARFDREARAISALTHPHICTLYDVGHDAGISFLVMEYLEGETLAQRLERGPLPLALALAYAVAIAEALDAAHRAGIIHRDLKPGNIMLSKTGAGSASSPQAKLLDFGLARSGVAAPAATALSMLPTTPPNLTAQGTILGTFQYMAPEQLDGQEADARTDIFAFGSVVYEMVSGRKAFEGKSQASLIGAIMHTDPPPLTARNPLTPPSLDHVVRRCLAKDPADRWQSAGDVMRELKWIAEASTQGLPETASAPVQGRAKRLSWTLAAVVTLALAAAAAGAAWMLKPESPRPIHRFSLVLPEGSQFTGNRSSIAISPDATHLVYAITVSSVSMTQLYVRPLDQLAARPIPTSVGTAASLSPFFSPDGQWVGFWLNNRLKKVATAGGAPLDLCETPTPYGVSWTSKGTILMGRGPDGIWEVPEGGGQAAQRIAVDPKKEIAFGPQLLPDAKTVLFTLASQQAASAQSMWDDADIVVQQLGSKTRTVVVHGGSDARYLTTGHLVYVRRGTLFAVPFDLGRSAAVGSPAPAVDGIRPAGLQGALVGFGGTAVGSQYVVSDNGLLAYVPADSEGDDRTLVWVDRKGQETPLAAPARAYVYPRISPDGNRIAFDIRDRQQGIWLWDMARESLTRVTFSSTSDFSPLWTPDGRRVVFSRQGQGIFSKSADGTGTEDRLTESGSDVHIPNTFAENGKRLIFGNHPPQGYDIKIVDTADKQVADLVAQAGVDEQNADLSPDGRWLAYQSNQSGQSEIYVRPYPDVQTGAWLLSRAGGTRPRWASTGRELFFLAAGGTVMTVPIDAGPVFRSGNPTKLFSGPYFVSLNNRTYDVTHDGQRFLMIKPVGSDTNRAPQIVVVENWFEELRRVAPGR